MPERVFSNKSVEDIDPQSIPIVRPPAIVDPDKVFDKYPKLKDGLDSYSENIHDYRFRFLLSVGDFMNQSNEEIRAAFLSLLFVNRVQSPASIKYDWIYKHYPAHLLDKFVNDASLVDILDIVSNKEDGMSRFLTGLILSKLPWSALGSRLREKMNIQNGNTDLKIQPWHNWQNCSYSEIALRESMNNKKTVLVNDSLLVKHYGYKTGLCLKTTSTNYGTFFEGSWYTPTDQNTKPQVDRALNMDEKTINLQDGDWAFVRDSSVFLNEGSRERLLKDAASYSGL